MASSLDLELRLLLWAPAGSLRPIRSSSSWQNIIWSAEPEFCNPFKEPRNWFPALAGWGTTTLFYRPVRLHWLAESIPWNRFLGSWNVYKFGLKLRQLGFWDMVNLCAECSLGFALNEMKSHWEQKSVHNLKNILVYTALHLLIPSESDFSFYLKLNSC